MGGNLYPDLKRILTEAGCWFIRQGKGSHEIWGSPLVENTFTVPRNTINRHTANAVLKQAGLDKAF
jgi:predicted RNA binding protein YcfA (HicA-like mRNA interferase family)